MAKKSTEVKFTQEELTSLQSLQQGYDNVRNSLGALELSRINLEQRLEGLSNEKFRIEAEYTKLQETEQQLVAELTKKYGQGNLDPTTGVFTPAK
jgi:predicted nuclease with TOPRIM domain